MKQALGSAPSQLGQERCPVQILSWKDEHPRTAKWGLWCGAEETFFQKDLFILHLMSSWNIKLEAKHLWNQIPLINTAAILKPTSRSERGKFLTWLYSVPALLDTASFLWWRFSASLCISRASQVVLVVKNPFASIGDLRDVCLIPGLGRSPGGRHGNPAPDSCLENPRDREAWWVTIHRVTNSWTQLGQLSTQHSYKLTLIMGNCTCH